MLRPITVQSANRISALVVGPAGIGKTSLLRTLCGQTFKEGKWEKTGEVEKVFVLSAESGLLCVRDLIQSGDVKGCEIGSLMEFQEAQRMCMSNEFLAKGYKWLFIDSLTEIASRCSETLQKKYPGKSDSFKLWGEYTQTMTDIIKTFRDMQEYNVVFTCLEAIDKDEYGSRILTPDIQGSGLKNRLTSYFDEVFHMEKQKTAEGAAIVFSTAEPVGLAKDRSGKLDAYEIPSLSHVKNKILA